MAFIQGTTGNDNLVGTAQQDFIDGRGGADIIDGGGGFDYLDFQSATGGVSANLTTGDGDDSVVNVEAIRGSNFNDQLTGNSGLNRLRGMEGNDVLDGGAGNRFGRRTGVARASQPIFTLHVFLGNRRHTLHHSDRFNRVMPGRRLARKHDGIGSI